MLNIFMSSIKVLLATFLKPKYIQAKYANTSIAIPMLSKTVLCMFFFSFFGIFIAFSISADIFSLSKGFLLFSFAFFGSSLISGICSILSMFSICSFIICFIFSSFFFDLLICSDFSIFFVSFFTSFFASSFILFSLLL